MMEPASDDEEEMSTNPFIVLDSQRPQKLEEGDKATEEREPDRHAAILENLEISRVSCPDTPAHLQGSEERQKRQELELKLDIPATSLNVSHEILSTTKSPTSFTSSSGAVSGELCALSSSTYDSDTKSPNFGISTQNVPLSAVERKSGSLSSSSSIYPHSSSSSHHSQDTTSIPPSPEFRKPVGTALHRSSTSSSQNSSSESISFHKPDSQHYSTPAELSSRDVTSIDTPQMKSTPADGSFECLQLSGDVAKSVASVYSLPDPLPSSPSCLSGTSVSGCLAPGILSESDIGLSSNFSGSEETRNQSKLHKMAHGKPGVGSALPKWVKDVREKKIEKKIHFSSSSDSAHKSGSSSPGSSTSEDKSPPHRPMATNTQHAESRVPEQRPGKAFKLIFKDIQEELSSEDFEESCVYPIQDVAQSSNSNKSSAGSEQMDRANKPDTIVPQTVGSQEVKNADEAASVETEARKHLFSDMEIEMSQDLFNPPLTASETARSSQPCVKDRPLVLEEKAKISTFESLEEDNMPASAGNNAIELNLFLSQTQPGPSQAQHRSSQSQAGPNQSQAGPSQVQLRPSETQLCASQVQEGPNQSTKLNETASDIRSSLFETRDSNGSAKTTPSQSIINSKDIATTSGTPLHSVREVEIRISPTTEKEIEEPQRLNIPKDVIERVVAADTATESSSNKFHFTLPPEGESIHPQRTMTPPVGKTAEEIEQTEEEFSERVQSFAVKDKRDETASEANTQDSVKAIATEQPSTSMLEPESYASEEDEESIDIPKIVGFPPSNIGRDRGRNIDEEEVESETIFAKALMAGRGSAKRDVHSTSPDTDPFAFSEREKEDSQPTKKRRRLDELPEPQPSTSKEIPKPSLPVPTKPPCATSNDDETYCLSITDTIEEVETRTKRKMVTVYLSLKTDKLIKRIEETEPEEKTVVTKCLTSTRDIVPIDDLNLDSKGANRKGKKSPRKSPKGACRTSPRGHKRRRSSSSTPPGDVSAVPKDRPNKKGKAEDTPVRSSNTRKSKEESKQAKDHSKKSKKTKKAKHKKESRRAKEKAIRSKEKLGDPHVKPDEEKTEYEKLLELEWESMRRTTRKTRTAVEETNEAGGIKIGSRGFGRWSDGCYYPGKITSKTDDGRYNMAFDDGNNLLLIPSYFVTLDVLRVGQRLFGFKRDEACFNIATLVAVHKHKHGKSPDYDLRFDCDKKRVRRVETGDIMLDSEQIQEYIETESEYVSGDDQPILAPKGQSSLTLDINENKRAREKKVTLRKKEMRLKRAEELVVGSRDLSSPTCEDSEDQQPEGSPRKRKRNITGKCPDGFNVDTDDATEFLDEKRKDSVIRNQSKMEKIEKLNLKQDDPEFIELYGPLPTNKNLFRGYAFLITYIAPKVTDHQTKLRCEGFKRPYIGCQIVAGGGTVVESIKELLDVPPETIILIAPMAQLTIKYYFALSNGVPCLSHAWLQRCCKENKLVDKEEYCLEAGIDYMSGEMIMAPKGTKVFSGRKIFLQIASSAKCDKEELALAVKFAGGEIISKLPKIKRDDNPADDEHCDFILVGDNVFLNRSVVARADLLGIPCVTQRYFNQCVTHGEILDPYIDSFKYVAKKS